MKITELRCPACHGTMKLDENNPNLAVCEYCGSKYVLEREGNDARIAENPPPNPSVQDYMPKNMRKEAKKEEEKENKRKNTRIRDAVIAFAAAFVLIIIARAVGGNPGTSAGNKAPETAAASVDTDGKNAAKEEEEKILLKGTLAEAAEQIFGKPASEISESELSEIAWLGVRYWDSGQSLQIGYSMDDPYGNPEAELTWLSFDRSGASIDSESLGAFSGLAKISFSTSLSGKPIKGSNLKGISCYAESPAEVAAMLEHPEEIVDLEITAGLKSLDGLSEFPALERLWLDCYNLTDLTNLANAKSVTSLALESCDKVTDFSVLSVMPQITDLTVESEGLKALTFLSKMPDLASLRIADAGLINLAGLADRADTLTAFEIEDCGNLKDCSELLTLTGLTHLLIEVPYNCEQPDLSPLTKMRELTVYGFDSVSFLKSMPDLEKLSLRSTTVDDSSVFGGLGNLQELTCVSRGSSLERLDYIAKLTSLKKLELTGDNYYDISAVFNLPELETLILNGFECEINFDKLQDNPSLKRLEMDGVKLYKNVKVDGGGGFLYVDWDNVVLDEHTDFLAHYPNLEYLSLADNELTKVDFAASLGNLKELDISDNYVTDLKPLAQLLSLTTLDITGNPVDNVRVLDEKVQIIK